VVGAPLAATPPPLFCAGECHPPTNTGSGLVSATPHRSPAPPAVWRRPHTGLPLALPSRLYPAASFKKCRPPSSQVFLPAPFSPPSKSHATPPVLPLCISSVIDRQRATAVLESHEAPLPTAPFGEICLHRLLFLRWPTSHLPLAPPVLQVLPPPP
jgi:hypothetical protein